MTFDEISSLLQEYIDFHTSWIIHFENNPKNESQYTYVGSKVYHLDRRSKMLEVKRKFDILF